MFVNLQKVKNNKLKQVKKLLYLEYWRKVAKALKILY